MATEYDVHTHVGVDLGFNLRGWWPYAATAQNLIDELKRHNVDHAVAFPFVLASAFDPYVFAESGDVTLSEDRVPYDPENQLLVQEIERIDKSRCLLPFAMFDPNRAVEEQMVRLRKLVGKIAGLKLQGTVIQSKVRGLLDVGRPIMEFAAEHSLPVLIHTSYALDDEWSQLRDCLDVAIANPNVRFNLAHSLRYHLPSLEEATSLENVWVDCSAHLVHCFGAVNDLPHVAPKGQRPDLDYSNPSAVLEGIHAILGNRYIWGSDNPFMSWCDDGLSFITSYEEEITAVRDTAPMVREDMLSVGPRSWLYGANA